MLSYTLPHLSLLSSLYSMFSLSACSYLSSLSYIYCSFLNSSIFHISPYILSRKMMSFLCHSTRLLILLSLSSLRNYTNSSPHNITSNSILCFVSLSPSASLFLFIPFCISLSNSVFSNSVLSFLSHTSLSFLLALLVSYSDPLCILHTSHFLFIYSLLYILSIPSRYLCYLSSPLPSLFLSYCSLSSFSLSYIFFLLIFLLFILSLLLLSHFSSLSLSRSLFRPLSTLILSSFSSSFLHISYSLLLLFSLTFYRSLSHVLLPSVLLCPILNIHDSLSFLRNSVVLNFPHTPMLSFLDLFCICSYLSLSHCLSTTYAHPQISLF